MRIVVTTLMVGFFGGFLGFQLMVASGYWYTSREEVKLWFWLFLMLWLVLGAIIGGAWEIVAAINQTKESQHPTDESKEADRQV